MGVLASATLQLVPVPIASFPLLVPPGWRASAPDAKRNGDPCPNSTLRADRTYRTYGQPHPIERPVLYDSFEDPRGEYQHHATDITCARGTPVVAPVDGTITESWRYQGETRPGVGRSERGGYYVHMRDDEGNAHYFAHLDAPALVRSGQRVRAGDKLGICGSTGNAEGGCPHLHYGIRDPQGRAINPYTLLKPIYDAGGWQGQPRSVGAPGWAYSVAVVAGLSAGVALASWLSRR